MAFWNRNPEPEKSSYQLDNENKQLQLNIMTLSDQLENFKKISFKYQDEYNRLAKKVKNFCLIILDYQYAKSQLGGHNRIGDMGVFEIMDYCEVEYRKKANEERQLLIDLTNQLKEKDLQIDGLKAQISRYMLKEQQLKEFGEENIEQPEDENNTDKSNESVQSEIQTQAEQNTIKPLEFKNTQFKKDEGKHKPASNKHNSIMKMSVIEDDEYMPVSYPAHAQNSGSNNPATRDEHIENHQNRRSSEEIKSTFKSPSNEKQTENNSKTFGSNKSINDNPVVRKIEITDKDEDAEQKNLKNAESSNIIQSRAEEINNNSHHSKIDTTDNSNEEAIVESIKTQVHAKEEKQNSNEIMAHIVNLNDYINNMNDIMWDIVLAIGKDGLSESKDIKKMVVNDNITESAFNTALSQLRKMHIIEQERINTGWRWFHAYELSDIGNRIYLEKYKKSPVECEKQILKKEHTTALHGYCIKDTAYIIKVSFGYDEAVTERKSNSMKLYSGETYIPDVIAKKKEGALVDYFEVELGHHTQKDFNAKCDKMRMVTKDLYFVVPDADTMNKTLARQIGQWTLEKGGRDKLKGTTIYLTTLTKLNEGKWENIYPFN